jgi:hypothetical protein
VRYLKLAEELIGRPTVPTLKPMCHNSFGMGWQSLRGNKNMIFQLSNVAVTGGLKDLPLYLLHKNSDNNLIYCCGVTF